MRVQKLPPPSRFMFWCTAPFLVATIVLLPLLARPAELTGWVILAALVLLCLFVLMGFWNAERFWWCWRAVGGIVAGGYLAYFIAMIADGQFFGDGRRSSATALNALMGLIVFGYPGFMWAVFGRFTWKPDKNLPSADGTMTNSPSDFEWAFGRSTHTEFDAFLVEFTDYNCEIMKIEPLIGDFVLSEEPSITVRFQGVPEGEDDYDDLSVNITSRDGGPLRFFEFMFLVNNAVHPYLCEADHVFFEGLSEAGHIDGTPAFLMQQGS